MSDSAAQPAGDRPVVYDLAPDCTIEDLEEGAYYTATVDGVVEYGMFVQLSVAVSGLVHESNYDGGYEEGEELVVKLTAIKDNGDLGFVPAEFEEGEYVTERVEHEYEATPVTELEEHTGETVHVDGEIVQIKQTGGPTLFHVGDTSGVVPCAAFEQAGVRAYPDLETGDVVHVVGEVERREGGLQIEADGIDRLEGERAAEVQQARETAIEDRAAPHEIDPLVEWPALAKLFPDLERVAERLRRAALANRPIVIRHHADTDGIAASVPLERALRQFIAATHTDPDAAQHLLKRLPSKAPFYELEDVTRDLGHALSNRDRHGQRLPLLVMVDNGSTTDDVPAYQQLESYGIETIVIDHHHPDHEAVAPYVAEHVNPYRHGEDYRITAGMLCVELARMIEPELTPTIEHVPAVAGLADRSAADAMAEYFALAEEAGYDRDHLEDVSEALDYAAYWLRYNPGAGVVEEVLDVRPAEDRDPERHERLVELLASGARRDIERQLDAAMPHIESERLANDVRLFRIDVDEHAHRFTYPAPGTTTGAIHDRMVEEFGEPAITIGYGPDFAVLRSDGVRLDIPTMVEELNDELAGAGVDGGGHLVVGSIGFVKGMREPVLDALVEKMTEAEIDESLGAASGPREADD